MSNAGQALSAVAGAVIGFFVGGPQGAYYGFQIGYLAGTALFPTQLPHLQGPRIGDGQQTVSVVGQPIPWIFGTQPVGGNIIWASPIREVATTQDVGGKGGPEQSQTTYTYFRSFAILLCEGAIAGVRRVWANGKIIYDARPQLADEDFESFTARQAVNETFLSNVTIYLGTEDQMPDPTIESHKGVGNVPAYRGYAYVVFNDVELKAEDGNRIPAQWKFEVYEDADQVSGEIVEYANEVLYPWQPSERQPPMNYLNEHEYTLQPGSWNADFIAPYTGGDIDVGPYTSVDDAIAEISFYRAADLGVYLAYDAKNLSSEVEKTSGDLIFSSDVLASQGLDPEIVYVHYNSIYPEHFHNANGFYPLTSEGIAGSQAEANFVGTVVWIDNSIRLASDMLQSDYGGIFPGGAAGARAIFPGFIDSGYAISPTFWMYSLDAQIQVKRKPVPPPDPCDVGTPVPGAPGFAIYDGRLMPCGPWERDESTTYRVLQKYQASTTNVVYPLGPARPMGHDEYDDEAFWTDAYQREVALGRMAPGLTYGVDYPQTQSFGYRREITLEAADVKSVTLASIVSRICERVSLTEYDVSDLEDKVVIGYQVSRPMAARAAIEPLRSVGFFDVVESAIQLRFPTRGKSPVATLTDDDLGAHFVGEGMPSKATTQRKLELELPRQVRVHFQNPERDYDPGEELSPARFDTTAESVLDVDLSVAITPTQAAQIAEILMRDFWAARSSHTIQVDQSQSAIEPADAILLPVEGQQHRVRIPTLTERLPNLRVLEAVRDDDGAYVSHAVGTTSQRPEQRLYFYGPVELVLLDLPALVTAHNDAGIYAASYPLIRDGAFRGVVISRATHGGSYSVVGNIASPAVAGRIIGDVAEGPTTIFDEGNEILVDLYSGELESKSESDVIEGANAAAIGANGRWEIIQFKNATNTFGSTWRLTGLLRGRKGTEHAVGQTVNGDQFVLLPDVTRIDSPNSNIGNELLYRAAPVGGVTQDPEPFTAEGIALKPYSPVQVKLVYESGDLVITWDRRDRLFVDEANVPMSESTELYEVDILDGDTVVRTLQVTSPTATYTAAQQAEDFGSSSAGIAVRVYQISQVVGRGYAAEAML